MDILKYTHQDVDIISEKPCYQGHCQVSCYQFKFKLYSGEWSDPVDRELLARGSAVSLLLYDPSQDKVVLVEQVRVGCLQDAKTPWTLELVAGLVEAGEQPMEVAVREAKEEANVVVNNPRIVCQYYSSPGFCNERVSLCYAELDTSDVGGVFGLPEEGENILVHVVDRQQAMELVADGTINNVNTIVGLQWLQLQKLSA